MAEACARRPFSPNPKWALLLALVAAVDASTHTQPDSSVHRWDASEGACHKAANLYLDLNKLNFDARAKFCRG